MPIKKSLCTIFFFAFFSMTTHALSTDKLFHHAGDPVAGDANGALTLVEFYDYQCTHCVAIEQAIQSFAKENPHVRIIYKAIGLVGPNSYYAAKAALAANKQNKFATIHHALLTASQPLTENNILKIAGGLGLDTQILSKDMDEEIIRENLDDNLQLAKELGLKGTPAIFIGKSTAAHTGELKFFLGEVTSNQLLDAIKKIIFPHHKLSRSKNVFS